MDPTLNSRLLAEARTGAAFGRSRLAPVREAIIAFRAKGCSYEKIAGTLRRHGIEIHASALGCYCRRHITRVEVERARHEASIAPVPASRVDTTLGGRTGPRIARDDL